MATMTNNPIDPGETWGCVLGIKPILTKATEKITEKQKAEAQNLPTAIASAAKSLCAGTFTNPAFGLVDYPKLLDQVTTDIDEVAMELMIKHLPSDHQLPYLTVANACHMQLGKALPVSGYATFAGTQNLEPTFQELMKFSELYAALEDPIRYSFGAISDGSLDADISGLLHHLFPTLTQAISDAITDQVQAHVSKDKAWTLPLSVEIGMRTWIGQPPEAALPVAPSAPAPQGKPQGDKDSVSDSFETASQETAAK